MNPSRRRVAGLVLALTSTTTLWWSSAQAVSPPPDARTVATPIRQAPAPVDSQVVAPGKGKIVTTAAEREDLAVIAADEGITVRQAIQRYGWQRQFADVIAAVQAAYPAQFAGSAMNEAGQIGGTVSFVGAVPARAASLVRGLPVPVTLVAGAAYSRADVEKAVQQTHTTAYAAADGRSVSTEYDGDAAAVVSTVYVDPAASAAEKDGVRADVQAQLTQAAARPGAAAGVPAVVETAPDTTVGQDVIRGGALLGGSSASNYACTSGWPVESVSSAQKGLVTADHCPDSMSYSGRFVLTWRLRMPSNGGDVQYMSSTEAVGNEFYYNVGDYRTITGRGNPSNDLYLCKFGRSSGNTCDRIRDTFTCRDSYCNLVSMDNREAASGDSGGPWYYGSTAYGVHSGYHFSFPSSRDQWTPLYNTLQNLGLRLRTG